ncbi:hypothetical protein GGH13_004895 [Coemansia sp. S155-1]|nr:hypothetical protein GGH13_004895 [Coemansia sp. S155-1]
MPTSSPQPPSLRLSDATPDRCWICLDELAKNKREWCYPCSCSLICHEECLLHWVSESERRTRAGVVRCPQCSTPYRIVQWKSRTLNVLHAFYEAVDKAVPFFLATIGSMAVVVACTAYGAYAIMTVYGPAEGRRILGIPGSLDRAKWAWLPIIPLALVWSRAQTTTVYMPLATLVIAPQPFRLQWPMPPSLTLTVLPTISSVYRYLWHMTLGRLERRWDTQLPPEQRMLTIQDFGLRQGMAGDELIANDENGLIPDMVANGNDQQGEQAAAAAAQAGRNFEATIVLNGASIARILVESLLLPVISSACGSLIAKLPFVRRGLSHFSKVLLGGCAYFVVKDLIRIFYKYLLFRSRSSRYLKGRKRL